MERKAVLNDLDYSHPWVTAKEHIEQVYEEACKHEGGDALDVGCFQGHSALAMALAGMQVTLIDIEQGYLDNVADLIERHGGKCIGAMLAPSDVALQFITQPCDLVMHDAQHGGGIVTELIEYWNKAVKSGGTFIVHDTDQIDLAKFIAALGYPENKTTADGRGRCLSIFYKP